MRGHLIASTNPPAGCTGRRLLQNDDDGTDGGRKLLQNDDDGTDGGRKLLQNDDDGTDGGRKLLQNDDDGTDGGQHRLPTCSSRKSYRLHGTAKIDMWKDLQKSFAVHGHALLSVLACSAQSPLKQLDYSEDLGCDMVRPYIGLEHVTIWLTSLMPGAGRKLLQNDDDGTDGGRKLLQNDDDGTDGGRKLLHNDDDGTDGGEWLITAACPASSVQMH